MHEMLIPDGLEAAIVGKTMYQPGRGPVYVVNYQKCVDILVERDNMTPEEANEFLMFNTVDAWMGEGTPVFVEDLNEDEVEEFKKRSSR